MNGVEDLALAMGVRSGRILTGRVGFDTDSEGAAIRHDLGVYRERMTRALLGGQEEPADFDGYLRREYEEQQATFDTDLHEADLCAEDFAQHVAAQSPQDSEGCHSPPHGWHGTGGETPPHRFSPTYLNEFFGPWPPVGGAYRTGPASVSSSSSSSFSSSSSAGQAVALTGPSWVMSGPVSTHPALAPGGNSHGAIRRPLLPPGPGRVVVHIRNYEPQQPRPEEGDEVCRDEMHE